ncbi:hypothetical protein BaRGS_00003504 [Batillaria attramentaria]|uniref:Uncharacterized protein n=1 Tax=Batillaria attramentaria TaxID=370345 RepID=A0ABD0M122_9CAEN
MGGKNAALISTLQLDRNKKFRLIKHPDLYKPTTLPHHGGQLNAGLLGFLLMAAGRCLYSATWPKMARSMDTCSMPQIQNWAGASRRMKYTVLKMSPHVQKPTIFLLQETVRTTLGWG